MTGLRGGNVGRTKLVLSDAPSPETHLPPDTGQHSGANTFASEQWNVAVDRGHPLPTRDEETPAPSLSQKAFQEDPQGFLTRLEERAMRLFESGYFAYPTDEPHCFSVVHHARKAGARDSEYFVRPVEGTCTCPFFTRQETGEYLTSATGETLGEQGDEPFIVPAKHLRGLSLLVRKTRRWLYTTGQIQAFCALAVPWMQMLAYLRRERIREEFATRREEFATRREEFATRREEFATRRGDYDENAGHSCTKTIYRGVREKHNVSPKSRTATSSATSTATTVGKEQATWKA